MRDRLESVVDESEGRSNFSMVTGVLLECEEVSSVVVEVSLTRRSSSKRLRPTADPSEEKSRGVLSVTAELGEGRCARLSPDEDG